MCSLLSADSNLCLGFSVLLAVATVEPSGCKISVLTGNKLRDVSPVSRKDRSASIILVAVLRTKDFEEPVPYYVAATPKIRLAPSLLMQSLCM